MDVPNWINLLVSFNLFLLLAVNQIDYTLCEEATSDSEVDTNNSTFSVDHDTLRAVFIVMNEGLSTPPATYAHVDPYLRPEFWPEGANKLTGTGKKQMFDLGKMFRKRYTRFLTDSPRDVYARSGNEDNNIETALTFLHGAYKARGSWRYASTDYLPIPVHTVPVKDDCVLSIHCNCPKTNKIIEELVNSPENLALKMKFESTLKLVEFKTGLTSFWEQVDYIETILLEILLESKIPSWVTPGLIEDFRDFANAFHSMATAYPKMLSQMTGPIYHELSNQLMKLPEKGEKSRLYLYSTVTPIMSSVAYDLAGINGVIPPPGSLFIIEFYEKPGIQYAVEMFYWNDTSSHQPNPVYPSFVSSSSSVPIGDFIAHLNISIVPALEMSSFCGRDTSVEAGLDALSIILIIILVLVFASVAFTVFTIVKKTQSGYVIFK